MTTTDLQVWHKKSSGMFAQACVVAPRSSPVNKKKREDEISISMAEIKEIIQIKLPLLLPKKWPNHSLMVIVPELLAESDILTVSIVKSFDNTRNFSRWRDVIFI
jgi:hypothetical protein